MNRPSKFYGAGKPDYNVVNKKRLTRINFTRHSIFSWFCIFVGILEEKQLKTGFVNFKKRYYDLFISVPNLVLMKLVS